jgi:F1F0 ATPase subunit 2
MDAYSLVVAFGAGLALGAFFSLTLWSSIRRMVDGKTPWYVLFGNYVFRTSVVLAGFFLVMAGRWERMAAALTGFVIMRALMGRFLGREENRMGRAAWRS